jgi:predicted NACHT family NTPase
MLELASVPILLTLICLSFSATGKFPRRRVQVYEEGIETLLTRWDASKNVSRDYFGLSVQQKRLLLFRIAFNTLIDKKLFFPQNELSDLITKFLHTIPGYETKIIDSEDILRAIEAHHGLLSERAHSIYSFSHLTFQEYFAAKEVVHDKEQTTLFGLLEPNTVASDRWREVILMTALCYQTPSHFLSASR